MDVWLQVALASAASVIASSGFWAYVVRRSEMGSAKTQLMMGLAYVELVTLGMNYINRGSITRDEYEDYRKYFYEPYKALGGNGVAERIMNGVSDLPLQAHPYAEEFEMRTRDGEKFNNGRVVKRHEEASSRRS